ncbi:MAG: carbohydrate binding family 9 domain-containing protein [Bacteroidetes bacterium]|nr:carbohydrate binding family 9 domain-containing protein [Bacteroidota bacterium]
MFRFSLLIGTGILLFFNTILFGQTKGINREKYRIHIAQTNKAINIDGILDEESWITAEHVGKFHCVTPTDTGYAIAQTEVMLTYDESNFYVGVICYDPTPGKRPIESLRRDYNFSKNDNFMFFIDTYNDLTNGFAFGVSAAGAQTEGVEHDAQLITYSWDIKWKSAVKSYDDRWVAEFSIPFRSIRYFEGANEWGINFGRLDLKTNEKSAWAPIPRNLNHCSLPHTGTLIWDKPLGKAGLRFSLIPYVTAKATRNNQAGENTKWNGNAGFDAKMILSTSMNLDLTVNPDYSQVEEDRQQTNLDRFELFFPERRQFFLENSDLFSNLGTTGNQPFFSRRIGLNIPVIGGGRLSGRIGNNLRVGVMDMQTGSKEETPSSNYAVAVLQRQVFSRSSIVGFLINKQVTGNYNDTLYSGFRYNRVAGLEYNLASRDNRWTGKSFYHQSFYPGASADAATIANNLVYSSRSFRASIDQTWIGADYVSEAGYIRRTGYFEIYPGLKYMFYPSSGNILSHGPGLDFDVIFDPGFEMTDRQTQLTYTIGWQNRNQLSFNVSDNFVKLSSSFDPTNTGGIKLTTGSEYTWQSAGINFSSDFRKLFNFTLNGGYGSYYNGTRSTLVASINYRAQPYGSIAITASYNNITLPEPYNRAKLFLIGPRLDLTFTDKLFLTSFVQYNNQIDNINVNIRFQWRFAPVSDLFIVYTENSFPSNYSIKNRGLVLKLSYWFN